MMAVNKKGVTLYDMNDYVPLQIFLYEKYFIYNISTMDLLFVFQDHQLWCPSPEHL